MRERALTEWQHQESWHILPTIKPHSPHPLRPGPLRQPLWIPAVHQSCTIQNHDAVSKIQSPQHLNRNCHVKYVCNLLYWCVYILTLSFPHFAGLMPLTKWKISWIITPSYSEVILFFENAKCSVKWHPRRKQKEEIQTQTSLSWHNFETQNSICNSLSPGLWRREDLIRIRAIFAFNLHKSWGHAPVCILQTQTSIHPHWYQEFHESRWLNWTI
jgi:hypothetical protein